MKRYLITVKGISYEVEVEELKGQNNTATVPMQPELVVTKPVEEKKLAPTPVSAPSDSSKSITCPMPGTIFKVMVKPGDAVKRGDVLIVLEAMKMENEIFASADEVVESVQVSEGATVNTGDVLVTFK